jgi:hypothetical protein
MNFVQSYYTNLGNILIKIFSILNQAYLFLIFSPEPHDVEHDPQDVHSVHLHMTKEYLTVVK